MQDKMRKGAEFRAAIIATIGAAREPISPADIWRAKRVQACGRRRGNFDVALSAMALSGKIARVGGGKFGGYLYSLMGNGLKRQKKKPPVKRPDPKPMPYALAKVSNGLPLVNPLERAQAAELVPTTFKVDIDRTTGRMKLEVIGHAVLDLGVR
jgi:hypothetical protein